MTNSGAKGEIFCQKGDVIFDWKIENFSALSETVDHYYQSPSFVFACRSWNLRLYPKGQTHHKSEDFIGLYLMPEESGPKLKIRFSFGIKDANEVTEFYSNMSYNFEAATGGPGEPKFFLRSELLRRKDELVPLNILTLRVTLKMHKEEELKNDTKDVSVQTAVEGNISEDDKEDPSQKTGSDKVLQDIRRLWLSGDNSDVVIKVGNVEFNAHRTILGARTPVLSAMFKHDTVEKNSGEVTIDDCDPSAFEQLLHYIYTGAPQELSAENAAALYVVADKYLVSEVKQMCVRFMLDTLCVNTFCDVVTLSLVHKEDKLLETAVDFFSKNMVDVMKTVEWQRFMGEHLTWANEITIRALEHDGSNES